MRNTFWTGLAVPLLCAGLLAGCRGDMGDDGAERRVLRPMTNAPPQEGGAAPSPAQDAMQNARPRTDGPGGGAEAPAPGGTDPSGGDAAEAAEGVPLQVGQTVSLTGCVTGGAGTRQYVLRDVRFEPQRPMDPHRDTTSTGPHGITQGSYVRLQDGDDAGQVRKFAGQHVTVTGTVADTGASTIGTAGARGEEAHGGHRSRAAADEHYSDRVKQETGPIGRESLADGTPALVQVTAIEATGKPCASELVPSVR